MPSFDTLTKQQYTAQEWMQYYKNIWVRNLVARTIDVKNDQKLKAKNPDELVMGEDGNPLPVKVRLENRKIVVQDALDLIATIDELLAISGDTFAATVWSEEALKVDEDMLPPAIKAGDACTTPDGKPGTWQDDGKGQLLCIPLEEAAPAAEVAAETETKDVATEEKKSDDEPGAAAAV